MSESLVERPAEPVDTGSTYGGFAEIARRLNARYPERQIPISRQLVAKWYACREKNGFPERSAVRTPDGKPKELFDLAAVERWHTLWRFGRQAVSGPRVEALPLFQVDVQGHPVDEESHVRGGHPADEEYGGYRGRSEVRGGYRSSVLDL